MAEFLNTLSPDEKRKITLTLIDLQPMIDEAEEKGLFFFHRQLKLWFSPSELKEENQRGNFIWGAHSWRLLSPDEKLARLKNEARKAQTAVDLFQERIDKQKKLPSWKKQIHKQPLTSLLKTTI